MMKALATATLTALLVSVGAASYADEVTPAWQDPDFVMEEIIATAPVGSQGLAWQEPGFAMEEIVVIAKADDFPKSVRRPLPPYLRLLFTTLRHRKSDQEIGPVTAGSGI